MEKRISRRAVERLTDRIREFIALASNFPNERFSEICSNPKGIPEEILEVFQEIYEERLSIERALFDRIGEEFKATPVEMMVFCDEVIHFGLASGGFSSYICAFLSDQLYKLDVAPYETVEAGMKYIQTKLDEADPEGRWTVSTCNCVKCLGNDLPCIQINTEYAEENEKAVQMLTVLVSRNARKSTILTDEVPYIKNMITGAAQFNKPEKIQ
jgi:hypothetical protein